VELMVAALVLLIGMLSVVSMLQGGLDKSARNNQRVTATNLARELLEATRGLDYDLLNTASIRTELQKLPSMGTGSAPWVITRRSIGFSVDVSSCVVDDPADKLSTDVPAAPNVACPRDGLTTNDNKDPNGDDFRRVTFTITWGPSTKPRSVTQSSLIVNPSGGLGPRLTAFATTTTVINRAASPMPTSVAFSATSTNAASLAWTADDGMNRGSITAPLGGSSTTWTFSWPIGAFGATNEVFDGTYQVSAQAYNLRDVPGDARTVTVVLDRDWPRTPTGFVGGHDTRQTDLVDMEWKANPERDVVGYRVFRGATQVCPTDPTKFLPATTLACQDLNPPNGGTTYTMVAVDVDVRTGANTNSKVAAVLNVVGPGSRPAAPSNLAVTPGTAGAPKLTWTGSVDPVQFYRVYSDGINSANRVGRTADALALTWTDASAATTAHKYWVTAVDSRFNESDPVGPIQWTP
jgi:hypothetical protein